MPTAAYIGTTANLLPLEWVQSVRPHRAERYSFQQARARTWTFASRGSRPGDREWEVLLIASTPTLATLEGLEVGEFGLGPFRWVPESAYITNACTPAQASLLGFSGGPLDVVDGRAGRSSPGPAAATLAAGVAVLPGQPVTISVDASGASTVTGTFRNATGSVVGTVSATATGTLMQRVTATVPFAPATARTIDIEVSGHVAAARPQVTWTQGLRPWGPGGGADSVVIQSLDSTPRHLDGTRGLLYDVSLRLREVG